MKAIKLAVLAIAFVAIFAMVPMDEDEAATSQITIVDYDQDPFFDSMDGGSLTFYLANSGSALNVTAKVTVMETGKLVKEDTQVVPSASAEDYKYVIKMGGYKSVGEHQLKVVFYDDNEDVLAEKIMIINVEENILSNWTTFVVIIVVIIVIAVIVFLRMRDNQSKKAANTMTFEELEAQRKADMAAKSEKKDKAPKQPASTERRKYQK